LAEGEAGCYEPGATADFELQLARCCVYIIGTGVQKGKGLLTGLKPPMSHDVLRREGVEKGKGLPAGLKPTIPTLVIGLFSCLKGKSLPAGLTKRRSPEQISFEAFFLLFIHSHKSV
jgi:hypothetical protein